MRSRRGKVVAWCSVTLGAMVLGVCAFAFRDAILEQWYIHKFNSGDEEERRAAGEKLWEMRSAAAVPYLLEVFAEDYPRLKMSVTVVVSYKTTLLKISEVNGKATISYLSRGLEHESKWARQLSAECLMELGPQAKSAVPTLREALQDRDNQVARMARWALKNIQTGELPTPQFRSLPGGAGDEELDI